MHEQRQKHCHLTLQLLWEEYKQANPEGLGYSWFCELYQQWLSWNPRWYVISTVNRS